LQHCLWIQQYIGVLTEENLDLAFQEIYSGTLNSSWLPFINCREYG
jgi:hypothetical protein